MEYQYLFFDADNTLFDFDRAQDLALTNAVTKSHGTFERSWLCNYIDISSKLWKSLEAGMTTVADLKIDRFREFVDLAGIDSDPLQLSQLFLNELSQYSFLVDDVEQVLGQLAAQNYKMLVITNGLSEVQRPRFENSSISKYFETIVISDEVGAAKPSPDIFDVAMQRCGNPSKQDVMMIGDNLISDIQGGIEYGIDTCWFNPHDKPNDKNVEIYNEAVCFEQILDLV